MPKKAHRILPAFRDILDNASKNGFESPSALMVDLGIHTAFLHGGASVFMCPEILRGGVCALLVVFPVHS